MGTRQRERDDAKREKGSRQRDRETVDEAKREGRAERERKRVEAKRERGDGADWGGKDLGLSGSSGVGSDGIRRQRRLVNCMGVLS